MRPPAAALLAILCAAAVAGCTTGDDAEPPNADPNGPPPSLAPTNTTAPAGTTSPSATGSSATYTPTSAPTPEATVTAAHQEDSSDDPDFPGLSVGGQLDVAAGIAHLDGTATNFGQRTYRVSSICVAPWNEAMHSTDGAAQHREPVGTCAAFGLRDFGPGESLAFSAEWNGTLWTENVGYAPAPDGTYTWTATFTVYSGGDGATYDDVAHLPLEFQVTVS